MYYVEQTTSEFAARGREGGGAGSPAAVWVHRAGWERPETLPGKGYIHLRRGDVLSLVGAGGGGFGASADGAGAQQRESREEP
jgi:N-methylhydantoinase B/oxoprolinase/acetone carboxylase alpha subunit